MEPSTCETTQQILNFAATAEAVAVTALGAVIASAESGQLALDAALIPFLQAARAAEQAHYDYLRSAGAVPTTLTFTFPNPALLTDVPTFMTAAIALEELFIAAYAAAAQEFAILGRADLAQVALQIGAIEAEHRLGLRFYAVGGGLLPGTPNDVAFERALFTSGSDALAALAELGFIGGAGAALTYPGPGAINATGMTNLAP
jgi:hypothetical protein